MAPGPKYKYFSHPPPPELPHPDPNYPNRSHQVRLPPFSSLAVTKAQLRASVLGSAGLIDFS